ncbi:MAG TPA: dipeptidase [Roseiflexaceae bacterium]|nr:dipeptidase [Roseiflexaceae bacterium]HMP42719.1 dipeptidase [Roseiflexaceae bacterium]
MPSAEQFLETRQADYLAELIDFVRIPSISALPEHAADVAHAAEWVAARLRSAGMQQVQILPTAGHPVVYGEWLHAPGKPTIMIYGHFDVQPVDPLHLWTTPPFEPTVRDGRLYGRGASDDKGNMLVPILAIEALLQAEGTLPVNIKFCIEGQEEIGSPQIPTFVAEHRDLLSCDLVLSADGGQWSETEPVILLGLRGGCGIQIDIRGATTDLHSGMYGGVIQNPIHALTALLATMRGPDGRILVEGFYDQVRTLSDDDRAQIAAVPFDEAAYTGAIGVTGLFGEPGFTPYERAWARPTLEINGIWGGFQGDGVKTVLPNEAHAKITCRLAPDQDPSRIIELLISHVERHAPPGVTTTATPLRFTAKPYLMPADHWGNQQIAAVHRELYGREPYYIRTGGSIPICTILLEQLGVYTANFGFGLDDEGAHAPDEFYRLSSFRFGQQAYVKLLRRLGAMA